MGQDIHVVLEKKSADGWEFFDPGFAAYDGRNYSFFEFLEEISEAGCPPELNGRKLRLCSESSSAGDGKDRIFEYYIWDATVPRCMYGFGYVTLEKLVCEAEQYRVAWVSAEFVEAFLKLGGVFPAGMQVATRKMNDGAVGIRVFDEDELRLRDYIYAGIDELRSIADEYGLKHDELRICFAFDC